MKTIKLYKIELSGVCIFDTTLHNQYFETYQQAMNELCEVERKISQHICRNDHIKLVHECVREDAILGYRHQYITVQRGWAQETRLSCIPEILPIRTEY